MTANTCLQYCINGMGKRIFDFTKTEDCKKLITSYKKFMFNRENQIKEILISYNTYFMIQAVFEATLLPKTKDSVVSFMSSKEFEELHKEIISTVQNNYPMLMNCLSSKDKRKLYALFD